MLKKPKSVDVGDLANYTDPSRDALLTADPAGETPERVVYLDQGWEPRDGMEFYTRPQGSRLIPYTWFLALEQPAADAPFCEPAHLARYGFLTQKRQPVQPGRVAGRIREGPTPRGREGRLVRLHLRRLPHRRDPLRTAPRTASTARRGRATSTDSSPT